MDGAIGAIADAATGAGIARAVEPSAGESHGPAQTRCLNCGTFLTGAHCHQCGQAAHVHRNVSAFFHDFLHSVLHFEGKAWRTLPLLAWRPGELTRRYIEGERAQFISPLALFLFTVFLTFGVFNLVGFGREIGFDPAAEAATETEFRQASSSVEREIAEAETAIETARRAGQPTTALEEELRQRRAAARVLGLGDAFVSDNGRDSFTVIGDNLTGIPAIDAAIAKVNANPALTLYKMQSNSYKYSWALILLSAPFLWLMFPFSRRFGWYDHLVFVTYSISFVMLLWVVMRLIGTSGLFDGVILGLVVLLYPPFHMYRQLRGTYRCSRFGAILRALVLTVVAILALATFLTLLLAMEAMG